MNDENNLRMKIIKLVFALLFISFSSSLAQKDTLRYVIGRAIDENPLDSTDWYMAQRAYCDSIMQRKDVATFYMPTGDIKGNPILLYMDTTFVKNEAMRQDARDFLIQKYSTAQATYFNLYTRNFPELEGNDYKSKKINTSDLLGKPMLIAVQTLPSQGFFDEIYNAIDSLHQRFLPKKFTSVILSYGFIDEVERFMEGKADHSKVIPYAGDFCNKYLMNSVLYPYYIVLDSNGVIQDIEFTDNDTIYDLESNQKLLRFYNIQNINTTVNYVPIWERLGSAMYKVK
jgi:hypothetical protein